MLELTPPFLPGHHCDENYHGEVVYEYDTNNEDDEAGVIGNSHSRPFPRMKAPDSLSRTKGIFFFIPFPFPNWANGFFSFPSHSRISGMFFFHSLPVPELWEWFFSFPSHSRICYFTDGNQNGNWITVRDTRPPIFQLPLHFSKQLYWGGKLSQDVQKWVTEKTGHFAQFCCK